MITIMGVVVTLLISVVFSVLLPTGDQGSDLYLWYTTINFLGDGETLFGCKACFRKNRHELYEKENNSCSVCFSSSINTRSRFDGTSVNRSYFENTNEFVYQFNYGSDPCPLNITRKILDLEMTDENCKNRQIVSYQPNFHHKLNLKESGGCPSKSRCCIERQIINKSVINNGFDIENELNLGRCIRNNQGCELCIGSGTLGIKSCYYLGGITDPNYNESIPHRTTNYPWNIKDRRCHGLMESTNYRNNNLTLQEGRLLNTDYQKGRCSENDQCCLRLRSVPKNDTSGFVFKECYDSLCAYHLRKSKTYFDKKINLIDWKEMDVYFHGKNIGGKLCSTLEKLGYAILIPIVTNMLFGIWQWYRDVKHNEALYVEVIFPLVSCYPQYKMIKLLIN